VAEQIPSDIEPSDHSPQRSRIAGKDENASQPTGSIKLSGSGSSHWIAGAHWESMIEDVSPVIDRTAEYHVLN
jgi:hypothetical protein